MFGNFLSPAETGPSQYRIHKLSNRNAFNFHSSKLFSKVKGTEAANDFVSGLHKQGAFVGPRHGAYLARRGYAFLDAFMSLANGAYAAGFPRFILVPKCHYLHHVVHHLATCASAQVWSLNPLCFSVQLQEDLVGRVARVSRRVSPMTVSLRTLQRVLLAADAAFREDAFRNNSRD